MNGGMKMDESEWLAFGKSIIDIIKSYRNDEYSPLHSLYLIGLAVDGLPNYLKNSNKQNY